VSRGAQTFRQADVTKALKGAVNAGLKVARVEIDKAGKIVVFTGAEGIRVVNEWDAVALGDDAQAAK
jgi:hypothetical protein